MSEEITMLDRLAELKMNIGKQGGDPKLSAQHVPEIREYLDLSVTELAEALGVNAFTVKRWESGENCIRGQSLQKLNRLIFQKENGGQISYGDDYSIELTLKVNSAADAIELLMFLKSQLLAHTSKPEIVRLSVQES